MSIDNFNHRLPYDVESVLHILDEYQGEMLDQTNSYGVSRDPIAEYLTKASRAATGLDPKIEEETMPSDEDALKRFAVMFGGVIASTAFLCSDIDELTELTVKDSFVKQPEISPALLERRKNVITPFLHYYSFRITENHPLRPAIDFGQEILANRYEPDLNTYVAFGAAVIANRIDGVWTNIQQQTLELEIIFALGPIGSNAIDTATRYWASEQ